MTKAPSPFYEALQHGKQRIYEMKTEKYLKDKKKLSDTELKRASEGGWFRGLDGNHEIYPTLYTPKSLPMMHWPSTQALLYLVPTKYLFQPSSQAHSSEITFSLF